MATADYNGVQKAAILLITLGPERSADIFKHLIHFSRCAAFPIRLTLAAKRPSIYLFI